MAQLDTTAQQYLRRRAACMASHGKDNFLKNK